MKYLVIGGAGYIGSHLVKIAQEQNHQVTVLDNFSTGNRFALNNCEVIEIDILQRDILKKFFKKKSFDCIFHFAAKSLVSESIDNPSIYYRNNVLGTINILDSMIQNNNKNFIFSSSAAIFGQPQKMPISENHIKEPINPYGKSKFFIEEILDDYHEKFNINSVSLRYFNAAGAHSSSEIGEFHEPETHLIPNILNSVKNKKEVSIFGDNYDTNDGTCIRDYVHVCDLVDAHFLSSKYLDSNSGHFKFNLGSQNGFSVLEIIKACEEITDTKINFKIEKRRFGDPDILIADSSKARDQLGWKPKYKDLKEIIKSAWDWHRQK